MASTLFETTRGVAWAKEVDKTQDDSDANTQKRYLILFADFQTGRLQIIRYRQGDRRLNPLLFNI
jgi:hypothetical protein